MERKEFTLNGIPAVLWGEPSDRVIVAVHGNMSHKTDVVIRLLAQCAAAKGCQVLSFDLPEHGERKEEATRCKVQECVRELDGVMDYAQARWRSVGLFGCSMGAYFGLLACKDRKLSQCLFLSPVVDMGRLIDSMMAWSGVTPERLKKEGEIASSVGQTLYWDYYCYVKEHPVDRWEAPTKILYGELDNLSERALVEDFAARFGCALEVVEGAEHFFHTEAQLEAYAGWLERSL